MPNAPVAGTAANKFKQVKKILEWVGILAAVAGVIIFLVLIFTGKAKSPITIERTACNPDGSAGLGTGGDDTKCKPKDCPCRVDKPGECAGYCEYDQMIKLNENRFYKGSPDGICKESSTPVSCVIHAG